MSTVQQSNYSASSDVVIRVEEIWKQYRYGAVSHATLRKDFQSWFARIRGKPDPNLRISSVSQSTFQDFNSSTGEPADRFWALKDVSFEVRRGEVLGIIGRNGAGKSTLLKIISRVTTPTKGQIKIKGRIASLLEVGTGFHPELTGRENVFLNGAILGMTKDEVRKKFDEIVAFAEVEKFIDTPVKRYSSGMYVRLAFSVAAHLDPEIMVVDEVLAVGDHGFQKKCLGKMEEASRGNRTVLFVSHNMGSISTLCSKVIWLDSGRILKYGKSDRVISEYVIGQSGKVGEVIWPEIENAPGNEKVRLKSIKILSEGIVTADVPIDKPVTIEIDYWNLKEGAFLDCGLGIQDKMNNYVFVASNRPFTNLSTDDWYGKALPKGLFRSVCIIPSHLLNDEYYSVEIGIANQRNEFEIRMGNIISFTVYETGNEMSEYFGKMSGVVRPKLAWTTRHIEDIDS
jgi:lipopolysaccharide transport system ATP-binding protein